MPRMLVITCRASMSVTDTWSCSTSSQTRSVGTFYNYQQILSLLAKTDTKCTESTKIWVNIIEAFQKILSHAFDIFLFISFV